MKPQFVNSRVFKAASATAIIAALVIGGPSKTMANPIKEKKVSYDADGQVSVQYTGADANSLVFHVKFENPSAQKFSFIVKNDDGVVVFEEKYSDIHFAKNVYLPKEGTTMHPTFVIRTGKTEIKRSFVVNTKITEAIEVTKL